MIDNQTHQDPEKQKGNHASLGTDPLKVKTVWRLEGSVPANSIALTRNGMKTRTLSQGTKISVEIYSC